MNPFWRIFKTVTALFPHQADPLTPEERQRILASARYDDSRDLPVLYLNGAAYEMGFQHGVMARSLIHAYRQEAYEYMCTVIQNAMRWPVWLARLLYRPLLIWQASAYWETIPTDYLREAQGIADGAGIHLLEVVLVTAIWEMYLVGGCSEFVVTSSMTADRNLIHGYNYDLMAPEHALINPYLAMIFYRPAEGIPFSTLNTVGSIGVNAGMNDAGISVAWDNTYTRDSSMFEGIQGPFVPFIITLRRVLQECRTLDEALKLVVDTLPRPLADIIILTSAIENVACAVEMAGRIHATRPLAEDAVWSANSFCSLTLAAHERRGDWHTLSSQERARIFPRYTSYQTLFDLHRGKITPRLAVDILRDPYPREARGEPYSHTGQRTTICRASTSFSLVMQPGLGLLWASDGGLPAPQGRFLAFDQRNWQALPELDFPASGFRMAQACAQAFLDGDLKAAQSALNYAVEADGESAPLLLMRAVLSLMQGDQEDYQQTLAFVIDRWKDIPAGVIAQTWRSGSLSNSTTILFPSVIAPLFVIQACADPNHAVQRLFEST